jgi:beta-mannosidase
MEKQTLTGAWDFRQWLPATVPGGVHTDLMAAGRIPDPFVGDNEVRVAWVAESDWEYRRSVTVDPDVHSQERVLLVCDGLDTLATVLLNGVEVGKTDNMFRRYRWDVKASAPHRRQRVGDPFRFAGAQRHRSAGAAPADHRQPGHCRRALSAQGALSVRLGLGSPAAAHRHLARHPPGRAHRRRVRRCPSAPAPRRRGRNDHRGCAGQPLGGYGVGRHRAVTTPTGMTLTRTTPLAGATAHLRLPIDAPQLWWPNGYGSQPLYQVTVTLHPVDQPGAVVDRRDFQVGLRTIELRQEEDEYGRSFTFTSTASHLRQGQQLDPGGLLPHAADRGAAGCAAARLHRRQPQHAARVGRRLLRRRAFYDLCDRYGILVWQDFIFSCAIYPLTVPAFVDNVHAEVIDNVRRLRHRASLALWCGNNEMEEGWVYWDGWNAPANQDLKAAFEQFFFHTLAGWVEELDAERAYWPSSPSAGRPSRIRAGNARGRRALLGSVARLQALHRLSRPVSALYERVRLPVAAPPAHHPHLCRRSRLEHDQLHHGAPPEECRGNG